MNSATGMLNPTASKSPVAIRTRMSRRGPLPALARPVDVPAAVHAHVRAENQVAARSASAGAFPRRARARSTRPVSGDSSWTRSARAACDSKRTTVLPASARLSVRAARKMVSPSGMAACAACGFGGGLPRRRALAATAVRTWKPIAEGLNPASIRYGANGCSGAGTPLISPMSSPRHLRRARASAASRPQARGRRSIARARPPAGRRATGGRRG